MEDALARYGRPEIFKTDQGSHFTSAGFAGLLKAHRAAINIRRHDFQGEWNYTIAPHSD